LGFLWSLGLGIWDFLTRIDTASARRFYDSMRLLAAFALLFCGSFAIAQSDDATRPTGQIAKLPVALDPNFQFRKTKIFTLDAQLPKGLLRARNATNVSAASSTSNKSTAPNQVLQEQSLLFERSYRLYGAVTAFDQRQRYGDYFDFFWRSKQPAEVTARFEYKQEKLRAFIQAKELNYKKAHGTCESEFRVIGDEFANDGAVLAWRCLLISNNRIVAEERSFLWETK
jgi:hypothetical protein